jgi:hypothetical protein
MAGRVLTLKYAHPALDNTGEDGLWGGRGVGAEKKMMQHPLTFAPLAPARGGRPEVPAGAEVGQMGQRKSSIAADLAFNASPHHSFA